MKGFVCCRRKHGNLKVSKRWEERGKGTPCAGSQDLWGFGLFGEIHLACSAKKYEQGFWFIFMKNPTSEHLVCAKSPVKAQTCMQRHGVHNPQSPERHTSTTTL